MTDSIFSQPPSGVDQHEILRLRRAAGSWIRSLRTAANLSQSDLARAVGIDYYNFISQIESGRARIPPGQTRIWAQALEVPVRQFAIELMRFYDPLNYQILFAEKPDHIPQSGTFEALADFEQAEPPASAE